TGVRRVIVNPERQGRVAHVAVTVAAADAARPGVGGLPAEQGAVERGGPGNVRDRQRGGNGLTPRLLGLGDGVVGRALGQLFDRDLLDRVADRPAVAERIAQRRGPFAVELVRWRTFARRPGGDGALVGAIDVVDRQCQAHARAAE